MIWQGRQGFFPLWNQQIVVQLIQDGGWEGTYEQGDIWTTSQIRFMVLNQTDRLYHAMNQP